MCRKSYELLIMERTSGTIVNDAHSQESPGRKVRDRTNMEVDDRNHQPPYSSCMVWALT